MERVYTAEEFKGNDNIGLRLIASTDIRAAVKLVDIDCDATEVVNLASKFLPKTGTVFGRKSKPFSHWFYNSEFTKRIAYLDSEGGTLIEIRVDHQTMCPPSIHPEGEKLAWHRFEDLRKIESDVLMRAVRLTATAALICRHYNPPGARNEWCMALTGFFLRELVLTQEECNKVIINAARYVKDDKILDRQSEISRTYAKGGDDAVTSGRKLAELMLDGEKVVTAIRKIWKVEGAENRVHALNLQHALIFQQSGDVVLLTEREENGVSQLRFSNPRIMNTLYPQMIFIDYRANGSPIYKPLGEMWLKSPHRRFYEGIELCPNGRKPNPGYYNIWKGFAVEPKKGSWKKYKQHILDVLAKGEEEFSEYILAWMAQVVQHPERQGYTAIALRGGQGVGKTTFAEWFGSLFGSHFLILSASGQLTGRFNAHFHNAILVFSDEAAWPGDRSGIGALRRMITEDTLAIERKGVDILTVKNHTHLILASNADWVVPAALDERRFAVFNLSDNHKNDEDWFDGIYKELFEEGGREALLYDLLEWKTKVRLRRIPETEALMEQKEHSLDPLHTWWWHKLQAGKIGYEQGWPKAMVFTGIHDDYCNFIDKHYRIQRSRKSTERELGNFFKKVLPNWHKQKQLHFEGIGKGRSRQYELPALEACRKKWKEVTGIR